MNEVLALLLAGGKGKRLGIITRELSKPAILFGGSYRLIDFPLSNCTNSGIFSAGVLTRHKSRAPVLGKILENGSRWGFPRGEKRGLHVLPEKFIDEYKGTADAVYKNLDFLDSFQTKEILILCTDHIYTMDYRRLIEFHRRKKALLTVGVIEVPWESASRFGILKIDEDQRIIEFEEKPEYPKSNLASMGIYIFSTPALLEYLQKDQKNHFSHHDFGKNIIPSMVADEHKVYAYPFYGYWRDVGTINDFWQANMDLVARKLVINTGDWPIYNSDNLSPLDFLHIPEENIISSLVSKEVVRHSSSLIKDSVISANVHLGRDTVIKGSVLMPSVEIEDGEIIENTLVCSASQVRGSGNILFEMEPEENKGLLLIRN